MSASISPIRNLLKYDKMPVQQWLYRHFWLFFEAVHRVYDDLSAMLDAKNTGIEAED